MRRFLLLLAISCAMPPGARATKPAPRAETPLQTLLREGRSSLQRRRYSAAITIFEDAARVDPSSAEALFELGNAYRLRGAERGGAGLDDLRRALGAYHGVERLDPKLRTLRDPFLQHAGMAHALELLGRPEKAIERLRRAGEAAPHNPLPLLDAAAMRYRVGQVKQSSRDLHSSVERAWRIGAFRSVARLVQSDRRYAGLLQVPINRTILELYERVDAGKMAEWIAREQIEERLSFRDALAPIGRHKEALLAATWKTDAETRGLIEQGDEQFRWGRFEPALDAYRQALERDRSRGSLGRSERARVLENVGVSHRRLGRLNEAIGALDAASRERPESASTYYQLALALSASGQLSSAVRALDLSLRNAPNAVELKKTLLTARAELEFEPLRDLPEFRRVLQVHAGRTLSRRPKMLP